VNKKIFSIALTFIAVALVHLADAQQPKKVPRIGFLGAASPATLPAGLEAFRQGLRDLGYVEGKNIALEFRWAEGKRDPLPGLAAELVRLKVDVLVSGGGSSATRALKQATNTIPIVMTAGSDPVAAGFVASLARPGGNITGPTLGGLELSGKRLELLKEAVPKLSRVAVLGNPDGATYGPQMKEMEVAARALGLQLQPVELRESSDLENVFSAITRGGAGALIGLNSPEFAFHRRRIAELAVKSRLPAVYVDSEFVNDGGLMSYAPDRSDLFRSAATYVDKILKGRKPADLPVEQPIKFELVINLKAAKQIGLTIPPNVLARADKVIK
jgi:putative ABC transport system substrate-binding protein